MKQLIVIANEIKDRKLRSHVLDLLRNPKLTSKSFSYPAEQWKRMPASLNWHHAFEGGLVQHTEAVAKLAVAVGKVMHEVYGVDVDFDALLAGALLHDVGKLWNWKKNDDSTQAAPTSGGWNGSNCSLDHTLLGTAELYARGFPEKVVHIVGSHFGPEGPTPPQTVEAFIVHTVDNFDAHLQNSLQEQHQDALKEIMSLLGKQKKQKP